MKLSNKAYNFLKWFTTIFLPAVGAFYYALSEIWDFERTFALNATINAVIAFLGVLLGISTRQYNKETRSDTIDGDLVVSEVDGEKYLALGVNSSVEAMQSKDTVTLNVVNKLEP
jgi:imidazoleglycerol phosphate synthase glutamine amidotransferase subunit HisH